MAIDLEKRSDVYVIFDDVEAPLIPEVCYSKASRLSTRRVFQKFPGIVELDNSAVINRVASTLQAARTDGYSSLAKSQPFVGANMITLDGMRSLLQNFDKSLQEDHHKIWGELIDFQPQQRFPNYRFPKGKNAVLYRGPWRVIGDNDIGMVDDHQIDVTGMDPEKDLVPVAYPSSSRGALSEPWIKLTNAPRTTKIFSDLDRIIREGRISELTLRSLHWSFQNERIYLSSSLSLIEQILYNFLYYGSLIASTFTIEELMEQNAQYEAAQYLREEKIKSAEKLAQQRRFWLTPHLQNILLSQEEEIWEGELRVWDRAAQETESGNFSLEDRLQTELEYGKFQTLAPADHKEYADFVQVVEREAKRPKLMAGLTPPVVINMQERQEAAYTAYEDLVLLDYLTRVAERGEEIGKRLVTVENLSMGLYAVEPIRHRLEEKGIVVLEAYMSSGRGSKRNIPEDLGPFIRTEQPLIAVVDGTKSVDDLGAHPGSFSRFLRYTEIINSVLEQPYTIAQWNPDGETITAPPLKPLPPLDPTRIDGPVFLLINYTLSGENVPDWLREEVGVNHQPGFFDDWKKLHEGEFFFNNFGLQITSGRDTIIQLLRSGVETYISRNVLERLNF